MNLMKRIFSFQTLKTAIKLIFSGAIIYYLVQSGKVDFSKLSNLAQPGPIFFSLFLIAINALICCERWRKIMRVQGIIVSFFQALQLTMVGFFFNFVIPGGVGGDVIKSYYIAKENPERRLRAVLTIAMDRLLGLFSMLLMAIAAMFLVLEKTLTQPVLFLIFKILLFIFVSFMVAWSLVFSKRIFDSGFVQKFLIKLPKSEFFLKIYSSFGEYRHQKLAFFKAIILSFLAQAISIFYFVYLGQHLGFAEIPLTTYFFAVPVGFMITAIPISPAGVGVGQAAFLFLFNTISSAAPNSVGALIITGFQIFSFIFSMFGAIFYISLGKKNNPSV